MILCVDPDAGELAATRATLREEGFDTRGAESTAAAREALDEGAPECLVTEYDFPGGTGLELVRAARETTPDAACVLFTDVPVEDVDTAAFGDAVAEYHAKDDPEAQEKLVALVRRSLAFRSQTAYPLPDDEDARLAALDRYAADPEALGDSIDRLTELATALFDLESAAIGLVEDHRETFLSCYGASFDPMEREDTICTYAILDESVTVVEDVADDPRFGENESLAAADIRFYAGAPIVTSSGRAIGTFCLHDDEPRRFAERDRELLSVLAAEAMEQLELRRHLREAESGVADE